MTATAKLALFAGALALLFGAAALAGGAVKPLRDGKAAPAHGTEMAMDAVRGLAVSERGLTLDLARRTATPGKPVSLAFTIRGEDGSAVRRFDLEHTKRMHLIVVRRDLTGFQHLHPVERADGTWTTQLTLPAAGSYRVFADFAVDGEKYTLADDLQADGSVGWRPLPASAAATSADGYRIRLVEPRVSAGAESTLRFRVTRGGRAVPLQDYLGAKGHLVALRRGDLAFLHVHPDEDTLAFEASFPTAGSYRLFLQFRAGGRVHTAAFTQEVSR